MGTVGKPHQTTFRHIRCICGPGQSRNHWSLRWPLIKKFSSANLAGVCLQRWWCFFGGPCPKYKHHPTTLGAWDGLSESCESQLLPKSKWTTTSKWHSLSIQSFRCLKVTSKENANAAYGISPTIIEYQWKFNGYHGCAPPGIFAHGKREHPPTKSSKQQVGDVQGHRAQVVWHLPYPRGPDFTPWQDMLHLATSNLTRCFLILLHMLRIHPSPVFGVLASLLLCQSGNGFAWKGSPRNRCKLQPVFFGNGGVNVNLWILKFNEIDVDGYITCLYDVSFILRFILKPFQPLVPSWYTQMFLL